MPPSLPRGGGIPRGNAPLIPSLKEKFPTNILAKRGPGEVTDRLPKEVGLLIFYEMISGQDKLKRVGIKNRRTGMIQDFYCSLIMPCINYWQILLSDHISLNTALFDRGFNIVSPKHPMLCQTSEVNWRKRGSGTKPLFLYDSNTIELLSLSGWPLFYSGFSSALQVLLPMVWYYTRNY